MDGSSHILEKSRTFRSKHLTRFVLPLQRIGVTANHLTLLSLIAGLAAVWFLFRDHRLFIVFGAIHLFFDLFDGVLARATHVTPFGGIFDTVTDNLLVVLLLVKTYLVLGNWLALAAVVLYVLHLGAHFLKKGPVLFVRTLTLLLFFLQLFELAPLVVGGAAVIGSVLQARYHLTFFKPRT